ncbi:MAG: MarR family transcriptional regulator [Brucellaceae bacterium]|nr:MarR family transcriptional regulator [Brucellaceae bacterium]
MKAGAPDLKPGHATADASAAAASKARLRLWLKLLKAARLVEADLRERFRADFASTLPRFDVMAALRRSPDGLRMSALSAELKVSNGNVTGIVDRLVADGLVVRVPVDNDRRAMMVRLTGKGCETFDLLAAAHEGWIDGLLGGVAPGEARDLGETLDRISAEARAHVEALRGSGKESR